MKKTKLLVFFLCLLLLAACKSQPSPAAVTEEAVVTEEAAVVTEDNGEAAIKVYGEYRSGIILEGAVIYTVVWGDTLSRIARTYYSNGFYFPVIMLASSDVVLDPDKILPGMVLHIPDIGKNLNDDHARAAIKSFLLEIAVLQDERMRPRDAAGLRALSASL